MILVIFGATGTVGRHLINQALEQGHQVRAFARRPEMLQSNSPDLGSIHDHPCLSKIKGDVMDLDAVTEAIKGADAVLVTLGSSKLTGTIRSDGTRNVVKAMETTGVRRLICQTTLGIGESYANLNFYWKYIMFGGLLRRVFGDHVVQEDIVKSSDLDWSIVRPAAFTDGPLTRKFKHGFGPAEKQLTLKISRADVAFHMLQHLAGNACLRQSTGLSY